jgi:pimeloyl-ACP methyl ester carboxylesterase
VRYSGVSTRALSVAGNGAPVILLHGFADSADTWRGFMAEFDKVGRPAIAVDMPGFGSADAREPGEILPQLDAFVDALLADVGPATFVGNSLGACASLRAASRGSGNVRGVVAVDEPALASHWIAKIGRGRIDPFLVLKSRVRLPQAAHELLIQAAFARLLYADPKCADPEVVARFAAQVPDLTYLDALLGDARRVACETVDGYDTANIRCPLLIVHGRKDRAIPVHASEKLHRLMPGSTLIVLPKSGHCPQLDDPAGLSKLVLEFLDSTLDGLNHQAG